MEKTPRELAEERDQHLLTIRIDGSTKRVPRNSLELVTPIGDAAQERVTQLIIQLLKDVQA
jgi:DUF971 family protein